MPPASTSSCRIAPALGHERLMSARNQLLGMAAQNPAIVGVRPNGLEDTPQYKLDVEHGARGAVDLTVADINDTLSSAWGSAYVNDFIDRGRMKRVYMQADAPFRMLPGDLEQLVRAQRRRPHGAVLVVRDRAVDVRVAEARTLQRRAVRRDSRASRRPGRSSGEAMAAMEAMVAQAAARHRLGMDRHLIPGTAVGLAGAGCSTRSRCWSCSSVSPRCTRAGRFRSR